MFNVAKTLPITVHLFARDVCTQAESANVLNIKRAMRFTIFICSTTVKQKQTLPNSKLASCESFFCSFLLLYLIFFIPLHLRISLAKRWLDLLNNSRTLSSLYLIKLNPPIPDLQIGFCPTMLCSPNCKNDMRPIYLFAIPKSVHLSLRDGLMRCKGTKNAVKYIICQIKKARIALFLMFLLCKCKRFVE